MKVLYRISEAGYAKRKPHYVNPRNILEHFLKVFHGYEIIVIADNVTDGLYEFITARTPTCIRTSLSNAGAFMFAVQYAIEHFQDLDKVYFAEDDYVYTRNAPKIIEEGLTIAQYSSGYDHPDKYLNHKEGGPNPYIAEGGELSRVVITASSHWKFTNSCCMTFATTVKTLKEDLDVIKRYCSARHPHDFQMFQELILHRNRKLVSPLPSVSTHGETEWLAKFIDWEKEVENSISTHS